MLKWREENERIELVIVKNDMQFYKVVTWYENLKDTLDSKEFKDYLLTLGLHSSARSGSKLYLDSLLVCLYLPIWLFHSLNEYCGTNKSPFICDLPTKWQVLTARL